MSDKTISIKIAIDIPVDTAVETIEKLQGALLGLTKLAAPVQRQEMEAPSQFPDTEDPEYQAQVKAHYDEKRREFELKGVQAYRLFRRIRKNHEKISGAYREIGACLDWPVSVVPSILARRRKKVQAYVKLRRMAMIQRLDWEGLTNTEIAEKIGISQATVNRLLHQARAADTEARHV